MLPQNTGYFGQFQADAQYLVHIGAFEGEVAAVFPLEGEVTAWIQSAWYLPFWKACQDWVDDVRTSNQQWSSAIVQRLRELGMESAHIGVAGLGGLLYAAEGVVNYRVMTELEHQLPRARFSNATPLLQQVRSVKSNEEVEALRRAVRIAELSAEAAGAIAGEGVPDSHLMGEIYATMLRNEGWLPTLVLWLSSPSMMMNRHYPTNQPLQRGDVVSMAIEGNYVGYRGQIIQPLVVGALDRSSRELLEGSIAAFNHLAPLMKSGVSYRELSEELARFGAGFWFDLEFFVQARGVGEDWPLILGSAPDDVMDSRLERNNTLVLKPRAVTLDPPRTMIWGDMVVIGDDGATRLGSRAQNVLTGAA